MLWPDNWEETEVQARELFDNYFGIVEQDRELKTEELQEISDTISHLQSAWDKRYVDEPIIEGVKVLHYHFARRLGIETPTSYNSLLEATLPTGYFEGRDQSDLELNAFDHISAFHTCLDDLKEMAGDYDRKMHELAHAIVSANINPDWKPPSQG